MELNINVFLIIMQIELLAIIALLAYHICFAHKKKHKKDPLVKHFKEYIAEGYTFGQAKEKLKKIGFEKDRIEKVMHDFLRN